MARKWLVYTSSKIYCAIKLCAARLNLLVLIVKHTFSIYYTMCCIINLCNVCAILEVFTNPLRRHPQRTMCYIILYATGTYCAMLETSMPPRRHPHPVLTVLCWRPARPRGDIPTAHTSSGGRSWCLCCPSSSPSRCARRRSCGGCGLVTPPTTYMLPCKCNNTHLVKCNNTHVVKCNNTLLIREVYLYLIVPSIIFHNINHLRRLILIFKINELDPMHFAGGWFQ